MKPQRRSDELSQLFEKAAEAWRQQEYPTTIALLEQATRLNPKQPGIWLDLGRAHGLRYDFAAAGRALETAVALGGASANILGEAGRRCQEFGHYEMAADYFERAANAPGASPDLLVALAHLYERRHRLADAGLMVRRALDRTPEHSGSRLAEARLTRLGGDPAKAESLLKALLRAPVCDESTRIGAGYELAANLDRLERPDEAMAALLEAKERQRRAATPFLAALQRVQARVREMETTITPEVIDRWRGSAGRLGDQRPLAILCGHPRSGTTLLEQMLDAHPAIVASEETHILHDEAYLPLTRGFPQNASILEVLEAAPSALLLESRKNYFRCTERFIQKVIGEKLLLDKNPALNVLVPAVIRIFPEARFLVAVRDPRDVIISCFSQPLPLNPVSSAYLSLESTVAQYLNVMGFWRQMVSRMKGQWVQIRYEELVREPAVVVGRILEFLGLPWSDEVLRFDLRARDKPIRSPSYHEAAQPIYRGAVGRWVRYRRHLEPYLPQLKQIIQELGYA